MKSGRIIEILLLLSVLVPIFSIITLIIPDPNQSLLNVDGLRNCSQTDMDIPRKTQMVQQKKQLGLEPSPGSQGSA